MYKSYEMTKRMKGLCLLTLIFFSHGIEGARKVRLGGRKKQGTSSNNNELVAPTSATIEVYEWEYVDPKTNVKTVMKQTAEAREAFCEEKIPVLCDYQHYGVAASKLNSAWQGWLAHSKIKKQSPILTWISEKYSGVDLPAQQTMIDALIQAEILASMCGATSTDSTFFQCRSKTNPVTNPTIDTQCKAIERTPDQTMEAFQTACSANVNCAVSWSEIEHTVSTKRPCAMCGSKCVGLDKVQQQYKSTLDLAKNAITKINAYREGVVNGAEAAIRDLELTKDVSFAIVVGCAAATAVPMTLAVAQGAGVSGAGQLVIGSGVGAISSGVASGGLNALEQLIKTGEIDWLEFWGNVGNAMRTGAIAGGAAALGGLSQQAMGKVGEAIAGRIAELCGGTVTQSQVLAILATNANALVRQAILSTASLIQKDDYEMKDFLTEMALALLFNGLAQKLNVAERLGGRSLLTGGADIKINGIAVTQNMLTNAGKLATGLATN